MKRGKIFNDVFITKGLYLVLIILFITSSCRKYLEKKSNTTFVVPETLDDAQGLLDDAGQNNKTLTPSYGEASADDYFLLQSNYDIRSSQLQQKYLWIPVDNDDYPNDWSNNYASIYSYNLCLELLEKNPMTTHNELLWKNVKGSALFYRAYNFLNLTWNYAKAYDPATSATDLGIVIRLKSDVKIPSVRSNVKESYERVITDAKEAAFYLPDFPTHVLRPSKPAAYGLLARAYLSMRIYDSALKYANLCLQIKSDLMNYNSSPDILGITTAVPFKQYNAETIFYTEIDNNSGGTIAPTSAKIDTLLYSTYEANDLRKTAFFLASNGYQQFKGSYAQSIRHFSGIATDEMFLTRAECYARTGNNNAALNDLNTLLIKRWGTGLYTQLTTANTPNSLDKILLERRKELLMRGLRWIDIKRLNKEGANIVLTRFINGQFYTLQPNVNYYALPLPTEIINLTGIPQNPYP